MLKIFVAYYYVTVVTRSNITMTTYQNMVASIAMTLVDIQSSSTCSDNRARVSK